MKTRLTLVASVIPLLAWIGLGEAAELRYIRIGEHKSFTRIVFEFHGPVRFKDPVIKERGKFSVFFLDTTTSLPQQISCQSTKRIDLIELVAKESNLSANIFLPFPYFGIKSFSLSNPERVVLDLSRRNAPPKDSIREESLDDSVQEKVQGQPASKKPGASPERATSEQAGKDSQRPNTLSIETAAQGTQEQAISFPKYVSKKAPSQPEEPKAQAPQNKIQVTPPGNKAPTVSDKYDHVHIYLLAILIALSVIIIVLLSVILFRKRRITHQGHPGTTLDAGLKADESIAAVDSKIEDEIKESDKS